MESENNNNFFLKENLTVEELETKLVAIAEKTVLSANMLLSREPLSFSDEFTKKLNQSIHFLTIFENFLSSYSTTDTDLGKRVDFIIRIIILNLLQVPSNHFLIWSKVENLIDQFIIFIYYGHNDQKIKNVFLNIVIKALENKDSSSKDLISILYNSRPFNKIINSLISKTGEYLSNKDEIDDIIRIIELSKKKSTLPYLNKNMRYTIIKILSLSEGTFQTNILHLMSILAEHDQEAFEKIIKHSKFEKLLVNSLCSKYMNKERADAIFFIIQYMVENLIVSEDNILGHKLVQELIKVEDSDITKLLVTYSMKIYNFICINKEFGNSPKVINFIKELSKAKCCYFKYQIMQFTLKSVDNIGAYYTNDIINNVHMFALNKDLLNDYKPGLLDVLFSFIEYEVENKTDKPLINLFLLKKIIIDVQEYDKLLVRVGRYVEPDKLSYERVTEIITMSLELILEKGNTDVINSTVLLIYFIRKNKKIDDKIKISNSILKEVFTRSTSFITKIICVQTAVEFEDNEFKKYKDGIMRKILEANDNNGVYKNIGNPVVLTLLLNWLEGNEHSFPCRIDKTNILIEIFYSSLPNTLVFDRFISFIKKALKVQHYDIKSFLQEKGDKYNSAADLAKEGYQSDALDFLLKDDDSIENQKAEYIENQKAEEIEKKKAEEIEKKKAEHIEKKKAEHIEKQKAEEIEKEKAEHIKKQKAERIEKQNAEEIEKQNAEYIDIETRLREDFKDRDFDTVNIKDKLSIIKSLLNGIGMIDVGLESKKTKSGQQIQITFKDSVEVFHCHTLHKSIGNQNYLISEIVEKIMKLMELR